jgi:type I restriction enzyme, S subunit
VLKVRNTSINQIPNNWEITKTGNICTSIVPGRNKPKQFNGDIPWITITDLENQFWISESKAGLAVSREELQKAKGKTVPFGTVIMTCVGNFGIAGIAEKELVINQQLHGLICSEKVLPEYLCHVLRSKEKEMLSLAGRTTVLYLNSSKCESINILLPPIAEQRKIAEILGTWDKAIALTEKLITAKQKRKKSLIEQLLLSKFKSLEFRKTFPTDWYLVTIGKVITMSQYGLSIASEEQGEIPILGMKDLSEGRVLLNDLARVSISQEDISKFCLQRGDILLNRTNSYDLVGKVAIYDSDKTTVFASYIVRFQFDIAKVLPEFVNYFLNSSIAQQRLKRLATKGVSQANINPTVFREQFLIPIPPLSEQKAIADILKKVDIEIELSRKYYYLLKTQKRGLMQKLLTGEWRVKIEEAGQQLAETKT